MSTLATGAAAEDKALDYLQKQGLKLVLRNYRCSLGEIDIIMRDGKDLVFVEVRARKSDGYGGGVGSVNYTKQQKIIKSASHYLLRYKIYDKFPSRFDIVSIDGKQGTITWLKDAFWN